jgi:hypothetical protein
MPLQVPQLDDRNFDQLVAEARARIPVHTPEWTNFNDSDPGMTLVQLFAFVTDNLLYRSNRIPEANRLKFLTLLGIPLQPATPGRGLVQFINDRGPIQPFPLNAGVEVRAGKVPFRTRTAVCVLPVSASVFYKQPHSDLDEETVAEYEELYETFLEGADDTLEFYKTTPLPAPEIGKKMPQVDLASGVIDRSLWVALLAPKNVPPATVRKAIGGQTLALGIYPTNECAGKDLEPLAAEPAQTTDPGLVFEIAAPDPKDLKPLPDPRYIRLQVEYAENVLEMPGIVQVLLPESEVLDTVTRWNFDPTEEGTKDYPPLLEDQELAKRLVTWIRIRLPVEAGPSGLPAGKGLLAKLTWVGVNAAHVIQAIPVTQERLGTGTGAPDQSFKVVNTPVIADRLPVTTAFTTKNTKGKEGKADFFVEPRAPFLSSWLHSAASPGAFVLEVQNETAEWETWYRTDDLFAAAPDAKVYALDPEAGVVSFGSGLRGLRPALGRGIRASYEYGGGLEGKVAIGAITLSPTLPGGFKVENPVPTWGASPGETTAMGQKNIARTLKHRDRLVTISDFKEITLRTPGVELGRVEVLPLFNPDTYATDKSPQAGAVTVMVVPAVVPEQETPPPPERLFLNAICEWLAPRRLVTTQIFVRTPEYVQVWVTVGLVTMPGQLRALVHREVKAAIRDYLSPLVGGPPVAAPEETCSEVTPTPDPCPVRRGIGWTLGMEVRREDLEAVAVRVEGVRYVTSLKLGVKSAGSLKEVPFQRMEGIQLPWLAGISVREGTAEDLGMFVGEGMDAAPASGNRVPVAVPPKKC